MKMVAEKQKFIDFLAAIGKMVLFFDGNGQIVYISKKAQDELGFSEEEYPYMDSVIPSYEEQKLSFYTFAIQHKEEAYEMTMYRKNHTCFPAEIRFGVWEEEECGFCVASNLVSVTGLKHEIERAENENKELRDMQNDFVANVTHELRTPLNGIKGHLEQLGRMEQTDEEQRKVYQIMNRCCLNMEKIINNILDYNKLQSGRFQLEETEFSLSDCIRQVQETNEAMANEKGLYFSTQVEQGIPDSLYGDGMHLQQVLNNLVSNAIKFTENGFVSVRVVKVYQFGRKVELFFLVVDSGIGISVEERDKIFESFVQADASITRKYGGTGLGLSITKDLLQMMGGTINLESEKGKGSTFSFSLTFQTTGETVEEEQVSSANSQGVFDEIERERQQIERTYIIGTEENKEQLRGTLEKLVLCIEMGNWTKAEQFAATLKKLLEQGQEDWRKLAFRIEMSVRREDQEKSIQFYDKLEEALTELLEG